MLDALGDASTAALDVAVCRRVVEQFVANRRDAAVAVDDDNNDTNDSDVSTGRDESVGDGLVSAMLLERGIVVRALMATCRTLTLTMSSSNATTTSSMLSTKTVVATAVHTW